MKKMILIALFGMMSVFGQQVAYNGVDLRPNVWMPEVVEHKLSTIFSVGPERYFEVQIPGTTSDFHILNDVSPTFLVHGQTSQLVNLVQSPKGYRYFRLKDSGLFLTSQLYPKFRVATTTAPQSNTIFLLKPTTALTPGEYALIVNRADSGLVMATGFQFTIIK